jgi:hypothetical protein
MMGAGEWRRVLLRLVTFVRWWSAGGGRAGAGSTGACPGGGRPLALLGRRWRFVEEALALASHHEDAGVTILGLVVVVSSFAISGWPSSWLDWRISFCHLVPAASWEGKAAGENRALTLVSVGDGGVLGAFTFLKASPMQSSSTHSCCSGGNPRSGYPGLNDEGALASLYLSRASFLEQRRLVEASDGVVFINRVADDQSLRHGAAGPR